MEEESCSDGTDTDVDTGSCNGEEEKGTVEQVDADQKVTDCEAGHGRTDNSDDLEGLIEIESPSDELDSDGEEELEEMDRGEDEITDEMKWDETVDEFNKMAEDMNQVLNGKGNWRGYDILIILYHRYWFSVSIRKLKVAINDIIYDKL